MARGLVAAATLLAALGAGAVTLALSSWGREPQAGPPVAVAQSRTAIGLDTNADGNSASSLRAIDACTSVDEGSTFSIDIFVTDVNNLLAWEVYLQYDRTRLEIVSTDVRMLLRSTQGSNVVDVSDPLPSRRDLYRLAAADIAVPVAPEEGSGVLARVVFRAKAGGVVPLAIPYVDFNGDRRYDLGPRLIGLGGREIGDLDGDGFFDPPVDSGRVVIGSTCAEAPEVSPTPYELSLTPPPGEETPGPEGATATPSAEETPGDNEDPTPGPGSPEAGVTPSPGTLGGSQGPLDGGNSGRGGGSGGSGGFDGWMMVPIAGAVAAGLITIFALVRQATRRNV